MVFYHQIVYDNCVNVQYIKNIVMIIVHKVLYLMNTSKHAAMHDAAHVEYLKAASMAGEEMHYLKMELCLKNLMNCQ